MKGLKHLFGRPALAQPFKQPHLQFVGEQAGPVEEDLKTCWVSILSRHPEVQRAYLALGTYDTSQSYQPLLCIRSSRGNDPAVWSISLQHLLRSCLVGIARSTSCLSAARKR